ncbi:MAG: hypothetical protein KDA63_00715 [Planctomycetales bacterium]|nr:hypothetical protein [Planctomycetales bacterium]
MPHLSILIVAAPVILISLAYVVGHVVSWRRFRQRANDEPTYEQRFRRNQFRRRLQASALLGVAAVAMMVGTLTVSSDDQPKLFLGLWTGVLLTVMWVLLLAGADMIATRRHANRIRREVMAEHRQLHDEIRRTYGTPSDEQATSRNGHG